MAGKTDLPIAGLLKDLKARGLLDSTLVVWSGEFGRTAGAGPNGRDHHPYGFCTWMAGGGVKGPGAGGNRRVWRSGRRMRVDAHDLNATLLRLMGMGTRVDLFLSGTRPALDGRSRAERVHQTSDGVGSQSPLTRGKGLSLGVVVADSGTAGTTTARFL
jgi:arylsulfatase A-like enzyme